MVLASTISRANHLVHLGQRDPLNLHRVLFRGLGRSFGQSLQADRAVDVRVLVAESRGVVELAQQHHGPRVTTNLFFELSMRGRFRRLAFDIALARRHLEELAVDGHAVLTNHANVRVAVFDRHDHDRPRMTHHKALMDLAVGRLDPRVDELEKSCRGHRRRVDDAKSRRVGLAHLSRSRRLRRRAAWATLAPVRHPRSLGSLTPARGSPTPAS